MQPPFDLILKEHEPPQADACRMMRKLNKLVLDRIPLVGKYIHIYTLQHVSEHLPKSID